MIIDFTANFNSYNDRILNNYSIFKYICPKCGAKHSFSRHATYIRNICFINDNLKICEKRITILRLLCSSCKSTHAILPNDIIPYQIFTSSCIINILFKYFVLKQSVLSICEEYNLSYQSIYLIISKFLQFINSIILVLRALGYFVDIASSNISNLLNSIYKYSKNDNFSLQYFCQTKWFFLMTKFQNKISIPISLGAYF